MSLQSRKRGFGSSTKKAGHFVPGFFFVDKRFEISNQRLVRDMSGIIKLEEELSKGLKY